MADNLPEGFQIDQPAGGGSLGGDEAGGLPHGFVMDEPHSYGTAESALEGYLKGASANWRDEIYGASKASGLPDWLGGFRAPVGAARLAYEHYTQPGKNLSSLVTGDSRGPVQKEYERARDEKRRLEEEMQKQNPLSFGAGELGGAAASVLAAPEIGMTRQAVARLGPVAGRIAGSAGAGAGYGALAGAGEGEGAAGTAAGAVTGGLTGAALGTVGAGIAEAAAPVLNPVVSRIGNTIRGWRDPEAEASRRVAQSIQSDLQAAGAPFTNEQIAEMNAAGTPRGLIHAGERTRALARSAANTSPEARTALTEFTQEGFEQQSPRIAGYIRNSVGGGHSVDDLQAIQDTARRVNRPAYRAAYEAGEDGIWTPELERLAGSPAVRRAMESAVERGRDRAVADGFGAFNPGVTFENGVMQFGRGRGAPPYPNMQYWDYVQRELRDMQSAASRAGHNEQASAIGSLHRQLLGELDSAVPQFQTARRGAAGFFGAEDALEAGHNFAVWTITSPADQLAARRAIARMTPVERALFARGYASRLADMVERSGDNRSVLNAAFFNNGAARQRTELALGAQNARQLEALLRAERIVDRARSAVTGNSTTARQLIEAGLAGGATGSLVEQDFQPSHILGWAILGGVARHGVQVIDQRVARRVGEMLASNDPSILARGLQIASRQPNILNALRRASNLLTGAGTEAIAGNQPKQGFKHGGEIYRAAGGRVNPDNIDHSPTEAQKEAGNYAKDHVCIHGLDIAIENAKGKKREGVGRGGKKWSVTMPAHYGYIKRTLGKDGDHVDVYLGPHIKSPRVYVVDQVDAETGKFDEHKAFLGFGSIAQVRSTYRKAFSDGRAHQRLRHVAEMSVDEFKGWLKDGDTTKPLGRKQGGRIYRADGGDVDDLAAAVSDLPRRPSGEEQWQSAIDEQRQRDLMKPSAAQQAGAVSGKLHDMTGDFLKGGLTQVMRGQGAQLPDWSNRISDFAQSEPVNTVLGVVAPLKGLPSAKFPITETAARKEQRINSGYPILTEVDAGKFQRAFEFDRKEPLAWSPERLTRLRQMEGSDSHPMVYTRNGNVDVDDGRHRIALAAERGHKIDVAVPDEETARQLQERLKREPKPRARGGRIPGELPASQKASHEEVGYISESPKKKQRCELCTKFISAIEGGPACRKVAQPIGPGAWCKRFVLRT
jgi:Inorganic Pyrophosphatase